jgi:hypothetical protein
MQPYPCATTTVTPAGRTALCPLRSILGAIGHLVKTKDLSAFAAGTNEPRSVSRPQSRLTRGRLPVCRQSKFFLQRDAPYHAYHAPFPSARRTLPRIPRISRTLSVGRGAPYHAYHAYHAPFPSARRTLPRIPRISRTLSVGRGAPYHAYHAYHAPFPSARRTSPRIPRTPQPGTHCHLYETR